MKEEATRIDINNREGKESISKPNGNGFDHESNDHIFNFSFQNSYEQLKEKKTITHNIIKSKTSFCNYSQLYKYINQNDILLINEINKKYQNYPEPLFKDEDNITPQPLFDTNSEKDFDSTQTNQNLSELFHNILKQQKEISLIQNLNKNIFFEKFYPKNNNLTFFNNITNNGDFSIKELDNKRILLNNKRRRNGNKKFNKKNIVIITKDKNKTNYNEIIKDNVINIKEEESNNNNKKVIFCLSKGEKDKVKFRFQKEVIINKIKKFPGRKKKNSLEKGTHDKFSKDNMMRKLKNKVMESARKLINQMIKIEAGNEFKHFKELRKIEGIYSQELNIKFNFWFYFQKIKDIFQFKMSSKYSKGDSHSNNVLINKIYSEEKKNLFPRTITLFELEFHQYYHYIFLGEKNNWCTLFDIKEKKYQIDYFLNEKKENNDLSDIKYKNTIKELASKYELFFLKKNPRLSGTKKNEEKEEPDSKKIIKKITNEQFNAYKYKFIETGIEYIPELKYYFMSYIEKNKNSISKIILPSLNLNSNYEINNTNNSTEKNDNNKNNTENIITINEVHEKNPVNNHEEINNNKNKKNLNDNKKYNNNNNKHILFDVSKKLLFEIKKDDNDRNTKNNTKSSLKNYNNANNNNNIQNNQSNHIISNINVINDTKEDDSRLKIEKEVQTENIIQEEVNDNLIIVI